MRRINSLQDVVDWGLCIGCGACYAACRKGGVRLVDVESEGIRPVFDHDCATCSDCLPTCPAYQVDGNLEIGDLSAIDHADHEFGPALEIHEGYAADPDVRYQASSGGLLSALALYCLEKEGMGSVVHSAMNEDRPWTNRTVVSRTRSDLLARTGSRYATSSPCEGLRLGDENDLPFVFIGKPCDAAAASQLRKMRSELDQHLGLVLTFFCAGTPSTQGTEELLDLLEADREEIEEVRYRGEGWPGRFKVRGKRGNEMGSLSYRESWGRLTKHRPLRCHLCPDGLGRVADISCGDAWDGWEEEADDPGRSIVLVRTPRGREILHAATQAGYVKLRPIGSETVLKAQESLLARRRWLFGRLAAFRLVGAPVPRYKGFSLLHSWLRLSPSLQLRTLLGTLRRILQRGWWKRRPPISTAAPGRILGSLEERGDLSNPTAEPHFDS